MSQLAEHGRTIKSNSRRNTRDLKKTFMHIQSRFGLCICTAEKISIERTNAVIVKSIGDIKHFFIFQASFYEDWLNFLHFFRNDSTNF